MNAVDQVTEAVHQLEAALPGLLEACTDPQATDMAELLASVREARTALQRVERDTETACARAMLGDQALTPTLRVDRTRRAERKSWQHDAWQHDARAKVLQAAGLKGAQGVLDANGEVLDPVVLQDMLALVESVHGSTAPRVTALRSLGLDPDDYCERSPGAWSVTVQRIAAEQEGETDAA